MDILNLDDVLTRGARLSQNNEEPEKIVALVNLYNAHSAIIQKHRLNWQGFLRAVEIQRKKLYLY